MKTNKDGQELVLARVSASAKWGQAHRYSVYRQTGNGGYAFVDHIGGICYPNYDGNSASFEIEQRYKAKGYRMVDGKPDKSNSDPKNDPLINPSFRFRETELWHKKGEKE